MIQPIVPLANWDDNDSKHERLVWWNRLDGKFQIEVQRISDYTGILVIFDHVNEDNVIHREDVGLAYGAIMGPDVDDVRKWEDKACDIVDAL